MAVEKKTNYGSISVSEEAVASLAGGVITESYGVVGMASKQILKDGWAELLKKENYTKGVVVRNGKAGLEIDWCRHRHCRRQTPAPALHPDVALYACRQPSFRPRNPGSFPSPNPTN